MNTLDYRNQNFQFNVYPRSLARFVGLGQQTVGTSENFV